MRSKKAFEKLGRIYRRLDEELGKLKLKCKACGRCCDFGAFDFILYASRVEFDYIAKNAPILKPEKEAGRCPYLDSSGQCAIHQVRPLGCRTFFCSFADRDAMQQIYHRYFDEIKGLQNGRETKWQYKPFLEFLRESAAPAGKRG